jgi:hypothetical protein
MKMKDAEKVRKTPGKTFPERNDALPDQRKRG